MNINRNFIIIFGVSVLLIVTIFGLKAYYQEKGSQEPISYDSSYIETTFSYDSSYMETTFFSQNYPISPEEANSFQKKCIITAESITPSLISKSFGEEIEEQEIMEILCILVQSKEDIDSENQYIPAFASPRKIPALLGGQYIGMSINLYDLLQKNMAIVQSETNTFNLCTITEPALIDPFREQLLPKDQLNINHNIVFSEGEIFCSKFFGLHNETLNLLINGFVPETDLFQVKVYLIPEDATVNELLSQESFASIENILQSYSILWNIEKPVI